ncbi:MAG TPA: radical SAM family heme chaperone HemW [Actinomycetota bacterium]|nr:radical SAM family heme chaperone HemW [Actinomycetota bacterium]
MNAGVYVHVPFCLTRCGYCDFNAYAGLDHLKAPYVDALVREADLVAPDWHGTPFVSVFLGGGTPTTLPPDALVGLLRVFRERFDIAADAEITVEANPDTVDESYLRALRAAGVTRLSMGAQSFDPGVLRSLERMHGPDAVRRAFAAARRAGFDNVNLDLIYGAHGESVDSWRRTLEETLALGPEHTSAYALTVEPNTMLGRRVAAGEVPAPDPDGQAEMYEAACGVLGGAGYEHYEVSNWARPGRACRHNLGYWERRPYLGLGAGAHSWRRGRRWWNVKPPTAYLAAVGAGRPPIGGEEQLDTEDRDLERLLLGLRVASGVPSSWIPAEVAAEYVGRELARIEGGRFVLAERGMLLASDVVLAASQR